MVNADKELSFISDTQVYRNNFQDIMFWVTVVFGDAQISYRI